MAKLSTSYFKSAKYRQKMAKRRYKQGDIESARKVAGSAAEHKAIAKRYRAKGNPKPPTAKQQAAREAFAARARSGAFKRTGRKAKTGVSKKRRVTKPPSPAQLAARKKFVAMVRARAKAKKKNGVLLTDRSKKRKNSRGFSGRAPAWTKLPNKKRKARKRNPIRFSEAEAKRYAPKIKGLSLVGGSAPARKKRKSVRFKKPAKRALARAFSGSGFLGLGRSRKRIRARNPKGVHLPGLPAKYQRMYEDILASGESKSVAAATTEKAFAKENPGRRIKRIAGVYGFSVKKAAKRERIVGRLKGGSRRTKKGRTSWKALGSLVRFDHRANTSGKRLQKKFYDKQKAYREGKSARFHKASRSIISRGRTRGWSLGRPFSPKKNPSPSAVFSEFRGKDATTRTRVKAANGTPRELAKLGQLRELKLQGKKLHFGGGASLAADGRKKLHIVGAKLARPNPPGEVDYGEIHSVTYRSVKPHIDTGVVDYIHKFGEEGGKRPHLICDEEGYPIIEGGSYKISSDGILD